MLATALAVALALGQSKPPAAPSDAERLKDVATYLRDLARHVGTVPADKERFPAEAKVLWERVVEVDRSLGFQTVATELAVAVDKRTLGQLENATFKLMAAGIKSDWYVDYLKNPVRTPDPTPKKPTK